MKGPHENELLEHLSRGKLSPKIEPLIDKYSIYNKSQITKKNKEKQKEKQIAYTQSLPQMIFTAGKLPQAVIKITGFSSGTGKAGAHLSYISRGGKLALEDQDGQILYNKEEQKDLLESWSIDFGKRTNSRDVMKLMLSAPAGTCPNKLRTAAQNLLKNEFGDSHEYVFALHTDTAHPHVHAAIKMVAYNGRKLNPRKQYLHQLREKFAKACRDQDIMVAASRRFERGLAGKSLNSSMVQIRDKRKQIPRTDQSLLSKVKEEQIQKVRQSHPSELIILKTNQIVRKHYVETVRQLLSVMKKSPEKEKQQHAKTVQLLDNFARNMPVATTRGHALGEKITRQLNEEQGRGQAKYPITLIQYLFVKDGKLNDKGVYQLSDKELKHHPALVSKKVKLDPTKDLGLGEDLNST